LLALPVLDELPVIVVDAGVVVALVVLVVVAFELCTVYIIYNINIYNTILKAFKNFAKWYSQCNFQIMFKH